jgi:hypothetical protein
MELNELKRDPNWNNGFDYDYDFVDKIAKITEENEDSCSMEQVNEVFKALAKIDTGESGLHIADVSDLLFAFATKDIKQPLSDFNKEGYKKIVSEFLANYKR